MEDALSDKPNWKIPFFTIWSGQIFSLVGSRVLQFALVWWLTELTGSAVVLTTSSLMFVVPHVALGPILGAYVDRWNRRLVMIIADGLIALAAVGMAFLFGSGAIQVWHVYVALFLRAVGESFHQSAMQAATALMVPEEHLNRVSGLNQTLNGALAVIGPPLGALALSLLPIHGVMLVDIITAAIAIAPLVIIRIPELSSAATDGASDGVRSVWHDLWDGFQYVWQWPGLRAVLLMATFLNFVSVPAFSLMPLLVTEHFGGEAFHLGWLESAWGVGLVLGGLLLSWWGGFRRRIVTSLTGLIVEGVGIAIVGLAPTQSFWLAVGGLFLAGLTNALVNGPMMAFLQAHVAHEMQGRVFSVVGSLTAAAYPFSLLVAGPVSEVVGVRPWYVVGGITSTLIGVGAFFVPVIMTAEETRTRWHGAEGETQTTEAASY